MSYADSCHWKVTPFLIPSKSEVRHLLGEIPLTPSVRSLNSHALEQCNRLVRHLALVLIDEHRCQSSEANTPVLALLITNERLGCTGIIKSCRFDAKD